MWNIMVQLGMTWRCWKKMNMWMVLRMNLMFTQK